MKMTTLSYSATNAATWRPLCTNRSGRTPMSTWSSVPVASPMTTPLTKAQANSPCTRLSRSDSTSAATTRTAMGSITAQLSMPPAKWSAAASTTRSSEHCTLPSRR